MVLILIRFLLTENNTSIFIKIKITTKNILFVKLLVI